VIARRVTGLVLSLWAGSLVTVCGLAAPTAFALLERRSAGQVAARLFLFETIIGLIVAAIVFVAQRTSRFPIPRAATIALAIGVTAPLSSELVLGPMMQTARSVGDMARFGVLHGVSALLFAVACICAIASAWLFNRPAA